MRRTVGLFHFGIAIMLLAAIVLPSPMRGWQDLRSASRAEAAGGYAAAASLYASAARRLPWQPSLWERAGEMAQKGGQAQEAVLFLNRANQYQRLSAEGWLSLGLAYQQQGDIQSAVYAWEQALPLAGAHRLLASAYRSRGNFARAVEHWQASLAQDADQPDAFYQLGLLLAATDPEAALPALMQAAQLDPALDPQVQVLRVALNKGFLAEESAYRFLLSGRALASLGEWDLAAKAFRNALADRPAYAEAWAWLAEAKQQLGQDSRLEMERALTYGPQSAMVSGLYGLYLQRQGQLQDAMDMFQKAAALEPAEAAWQMALAGAYEQKGDLITALNYHIHAVTIAPEEALAWRGLASFCLRNQVDLTVSGLPAAFHLLRLAPYDWQSYDIAGQILLEIEDLPGAEAMLQKAVEMAPLEAAPALHLGLLYLQAGERNAAQSYLMKAQILDPQGPYGAQAERVLAQYFP